LEPPAATAPLRRADDNVLDPNDLFQAIRISREWQVLGVWGSGKTLPEFEEEPSANMRESLPLLAPRDVTGIAYEHAARLRVLRGRVGATIGGNPT
jgi:hypothetical protein